MANDHSFYREAKKSLEAGDSFSKEKVWKGFKKYAKWSIYGLLTITTLWGCVNQFRHTTSQSLTQGTEFYRTNDSVLPNLYIGIQTLSTYQVIQTEEVTMNDSYGEAVLTDSNDVNSEIIDTKQSLAPLEFYSVNPFYGYDDAENTIDPDIDKTSKLIKNSEVVDQDNNSKNKEFSYSTSYLNGWNRLLRYDWSVYLNDNTTDSELIKFVTPWTPTSISENSKEQYFGVDDTTMDSFGNLILEDGIISNSESYWLLYDSKKIDDTEFGKLTSEIYGEDGMTVEGYTAVSSSKAYLIPVDNNGTTEFDVVTSIKVNYTEDEINEAIANDLEAGNNDEINQIVDNQIKYATNTASFLTKGSIIESNIDIDVEMYNDGTPTNVGTINIEDTIVSYYEINYGYSPPAILDPYTIQFVPLQPSTYANDGQLQKGVGYTIIPQDKAAPIYPTREAIDEFNNERRESWNDPDGDLWAENTKAGQSDKTNNSGWTILQEIGDTGRWENVTLYNKTPGGDNEILFGKNIEEVNQSLEAVTYGNQSELNYQVNVNQSNIPTFSTGAEEQNIDQIINYDSNFGDENDYVYREDFIGLIEYNNSNPTSTSSTQTSTTVPEYHWVGNDDDGWELIPESQFQNVISSSGQDPANDNRSIFTGSISDWGDSWDPDFGPLYGMFIWPLSQLSLWVTSWFDAINNTSIHAWTVLLGIFIIVFTLRGLGLIMSMGSHKNQHKMQEIQTQVAEIKSKYSMYDKSNKQMKQKQQQEIMALYRKNDVNPFASIGTIFITMPIFLSLWTIISSIPAYKLTAVGKFSFGISAFGGMFGTTFGLFFTYLLVGVSVGLAQGISSKLPTWLANKRKNIKKVDEATKKQQKKQNRT